MTTAPPRATIFDTRAGFATTSSEAAKLRCRSPKGRTPAMPAPHTEIALQHIRRIVTLASQPGAPITRQEAFEQIVEELELAGLCPVVEPEAAESGIGAAHAN